MSPVVPARFLPPGTVRAERADGAGAAAPAPSATSIGELTKRQAVGISTESMMNTVALAVCTLPHSTLAPFTM